MDLLYYRREGSTHKRISCNLKLMKFLQTVPGPQHPARVKCLAQTLSGLNFQSAASRNANSIGGTDGLFISCWYAVYKNFNVNATVSYRILFRKPSCSRFTLVHTLRSAAPASGMVEKASRCDPSYDDGSCCCHCYNSQHRMGNRFSWIVATREL